MLQQPGQIRRIAVRELHEKVKAGQPVEILDVRTPEEYRQVHVPGVKLVPLDQLTPERAGHQGDQPLYVICKSGHRSLLACRALARAGMNVVNVEGGTKAWEEAGYPVERDPKALRITR